MGWDDCFDFEKLQFTQPDLKAPEILRVLKKGGRFVGCSWEAQEDLAWMEEAMLRHNPSLLRDEEYLSRRPIGMAYEKPEGYEIILRKAGFRDIEFSREEAGFISTDEEEWWRQMQQVGWGTIIEKIQQGDEMQRLKEAIFNDLQAYKRADGIFFTKTVFFVSALK